MSVKERLIEFIKAVQSTSNPNISQFEKDCNLKNASVSNIRVSIGYKNMAKIKERYPKLNEIWLLHGQGEMLLKTEDNNDRFIKRKFVDIEGEAGKEISKLIDISIQHQAILNVLLKTFEKFSADLKEKEVALVSGQLQQAIKLEADRLYDEYVKRQEQISSLTWQ